jgi:hypothetical protein
MASFSGQFSDEVFWLKDLYGILIDFFHKIYGFQQKNLIRNFKFKIQKMK